MLLRAAIPNTWEAEVGRRLEFKPCLVHSETSCQPRGKKVLREVRSQRLQLQPGPGGAEHEHTDRRRSAEGGGKSAFVLGAVMSAYRTWSRKRWMV